MNSQTDPKPDSPTTPPEAVPRIKRQTTLAARGEPMIWFAGSTLAASILMVAGLIGLIIWNGGSTFWPTPLVKVTGFLSADPKKPFTVMGEWTRRERYKVPAATFLALPDAVKERIVRNDGYAVRQMLHRGNGDLYGSAERRRWISDFEIASEESPADALYVERREGGPFIGNLKSVVIDGKPVEGDAKALWAAFQTQHAAAMGRFAELLAIRKDEQGGLNHRQEAIRRRVLSAEFRYGAGSPVAADAKKQADADREALKSEQEAINARIRKLLKEDERYQVVLADVEGRTKAEHPATVLSQVVLASQPNSIGWWEKLGVYASRWREYLFDEPREANTEGGVFPAIFGTVMMTLIMSLAVAPFGVIAAVYLREYAKQGVLVSLIRIAVNNLAGVPSIVFGLVGLGFFIYTVGDKVDNVLYPEMVAAGIPIFKKPGILWASFTLALLTVPVVIVATEEALAAVPRSMREGSLACGASRWQTIRRIILPRATPGIMTGLILAMARGAGEVAPLMVVGAVKLAPELPFDGHFPWFHVERSFMHLGFHIYDVGFQSPDSEAARPMVYTTTLLLVGLVAALNAAAIWLRARLKRKYLAGSF